MLAKFEDINLDEYKNIMELNVFAVVDLMQRVIPVMRKNGGGRILNISSMLSKVYMPGLSAYSSTKYALNALSFTARQELAKDNIIVSVMHPKMTLTNFGKNAAGKKDFDPNEFKNNDRFGGYDTPKDVAEKTIELIKSGEPEYCM